MKKLSFLVMLGLGVSSVAFASTASLDMPNDRRVIESRMQPLKQNFEKLSQEDKDLLAAYRAKWEELKKAEDAAALNKPAQ